MANASRVRVDLSLPFPKAGVVFDIRVDAPAEGFDGQPPSFNLSVADISTGETVPLTVKASPVLADWVRGYTRWLRRPNVEASFDRSGINGSFTSDLGPEQVLQGVQDACDMIRQRFDLYQESVLA